MPATSSSLSIMANNTETPLLVQVVDLFARHGVEFIVIGGQAAALHGSPLATFDVDLCYARTADNLRYLAEALREIHPTLRGAPPDLPFRLDEQSLALGSNFTFQTDIGPLDLLGWVEPLGAYESFKHRADTMDLNGRPVFVVCLDDLITIKRHINRPKDQAAAVQLESLRMLRNDKGNTKSS